MSLIVYTKKQLVERLRRHISDGLADDDISVSDNELLLYIDSALAFRMVGQVYENAKIDGNLAMPEAYLTTYKITGIAKDSVTGYWSVILPQPPVSLPLGYSINRIYFADPVNGVSQDVFMIKAKRVGYRLNMPLPTGVRGWVENTTLWLAANNNQSLRDLNVYVQMAKSRTDSINETMALPDDAIQNIFDLADSELQKRYGKIRDEVKDYQPAANNNLMK